MSPSFQCVVVLGVEIKGALVLNGLIFLRIMLKTVQTFFENLARNFEHVSYLFPVFFFEHANANILHTGLLAAEDRLISSLGYFPSRHLPAQC